MDNLETLATFGTQDTGPRQTQHRKLKDEPHGPNTQSVRVGHHYTQINRNDVNETCVLLQLTGGKDEPNIGIMRKLSRISQHGTQNVTTYDRTNYWASLYINRHTMNKTLFL